MAVKENVTNQIEQTVPQKSINNPPKKVVKKIIKKVVRRVPSESEIIRKKAAVVDKRDHDIKSDYLDTDVPLEKSNLRIYMASIFLMVILILIIVGLLIAKAKIETNKLDALSEQESTPVVEEEILVKVEEVEEKEEIAVNVLEPEEITLEILNASGVAGLAGETQLEFENLGYVVESVGNDESTIDSQLFISSDYTEEELANLLDDVERRLGIDSITGSLSDLETTARIILGSGE